LRNFASGSDVSRETLLTTHPSDQSLDHRFCHLQSLDQTPRTSVGRQFSEGKRVSYHPSRLPLLREILRKGIRCNFHAPNGLHVREIDEEVAGLLFQSHFKTIRLDFETSNEWLQKESGGKVNNEDFQRSIRNLRRAGYSKEEIGVYVMAGLPGQRIQEVKESIAFVKEVGAKPMLVEYSPIPYTPLFEKAKKMSKFDLENEPLFHNNTILPCQWMDLQWKTSSK
jgi:radical SAM superfamily enzyme YgiQ (UPF0313 family)